MSGTGRRRNFAKSTICAVRPPQSVLAAPAANGSKVPHPVRSMMVSGCTCGEGLFLPSLMQHGIAARLPAPETLQRSLPCAPLPRCNPQHPVMQLGPAERPLPGIWPQTFAPAAIPAPGLARPSALGWEPLVHRFCVDDWRGQVKPGGLAARSTLPSHFLRDTDQGKFLTYPSSPNL
ncbi:hypothetical protein PhaeoP88_00251 [Phaeobacter inhibens]|uniref:Uncharacterized protein n=1 Tax=Phaeobacter inhibens TaxID=221822 RepID=A0A2I7K4Z5_9RHOB|nr:hypothetical protein PhaeoP88_00251 [Phaeobacter inhibens]